MFKIPKQEYTAEFKELVVKRAQSGEGIAKVARDLGLVEQTLRNWVKAEKAGKLHAAAGKAVTPEQMELAGARGECAAEDGERNPKKSDGVLCKGCAVKYAWIDRQRRDYPLLVLCETLAVSVSGYRAWKGGGTVARKHLSDAQLLGLIDAIHAQVKGAYGSPRMFDALRARGVAVSKARVERVMRENGIRARHKRRYKATTDSKHSLPVAENVLARQFQPDAPNRVWTADLTYVWTGEGWLYLAVVLDLFNREIVGWSIKTRMSADIVVEALRMAWLRRRPAPGLLHHSDRGSQYASDVFQSTLSEYGMRCSMSRKGNCWDNAPTESFFNSLKNERVHGRRYDTREEAAADLFDYIEVFYNRSRRHSTLNGKSPAQCLQDWLSTQPEQNTAA